MRLAELGDNNRSVLKRQHFGCLPTTTPQTNIQMCARELSSSKLSHYHGIAHSLYWRSRCFTFPELISLGRHHPKACLFVGRSWTLRTFPLRLGRNCCCQDGERWQWGAGYCRQP